MASAEFDLRPRHPWPQQTLLAGCRSPDSRSEWRALLAASENLYVQYQSPEWFDHLRCTEADRVPPPLVQHDETGRLAGIVPFRIAPYHLKFEIKGRPIWRLHLQALYVLGSQPLARRDPKLHDDLFAAACEAVPESDGVYLHSVPTDSFCWAYLRRSKWIAEHFLVYLPDGIRPFHFLVLPPTFEEYLTRFKAKKRYNFERQVRVLHECGELQWLRVDRTDLIQAFLRAASAVTEHSWQHRIATPEIDRHLSQPGSLTDLARRGLLRSYVLASGDVPCALVLGYQYRDVYHYADIAYHQSFRKFSPGTVLLYLLIRDLIEYNSPRRLNFGIGDAQYKREFGNVHTTDASVLLLRKTSVNALRLRCHSTFRSCVRSGKARLHGWLPTGRWAPDSR